MPRLVNYSNPSGRLINQYIPTIEDEDDAPNFRDTGVNLYPYNVIVVLVGLALVPLSYLVIWFS